MQEVICPTYGDVIAVILTALIVTVGFGLAYHVGWHAGYWKRVREEKFAWGIR